MSINLLPAYKSSAQQEKIINELMTTRDNNLFFDCSQQYIFKEHPGCYMQKITDACIRRQLHQEIEKGITVFVIGSFNPFQVRCGKMLLELKAQYPQIKHYVIALSYRGYYLNEELLSDYQDIVHHAVGSFGMAACDTYEVKCKYFNLMSCLCRNAICLHTTSNPRQIIRQCMERNQTAIINLHEAVQRRYGMFSKRHREFAELRRNASSYFYKNHPRKLEGTDIVSRFAQAASEWDKMLDWLVEATEEEIDHKADCLSADAD